MKYELWESIEGGGYSFFPADNASARALLEPDDRLIWTVEANSWEEASQAQYNYLGWGQYKPMSNPVTPLGDNTPMSISQTLTNTANAIIVLHRDLFGESPSPMKLQKLCYYAQGYALAEGFELFPEDLQAWQHGPVIPEL